VLPKDSKMKNFKHSTSLLATLFAFYKSFIWNICKKQLKKVYK